MLDSQQPVPLPRAVRRPLARSARLRATHDLRHALAIARGCAARRQQPIPFAQIERLLGVA